LPPAVRSLLKKFRLLPPPLPHLPLHRLLLQLPLLLPLRLLLRPRLLPTPQRSKRKAYDKKAGASRLFCFPIHQDLT
jgi:hypothetical protein